MGYTRKHIVNRRNVNGCKADSYDCDRDSQEQQADSTRETGMQTCVNEDGTTSSYFDKRKLKIAPRSTLQFKVGPSFTVAKNYFRVLNATTQQEVKVSLIPRIDRGFDFIDNEWIGYKRNYFTLVTSFEASMPTDEFLRSGFLAVGEDGNNSHVPSRILYFAVKIVAMCDEDKSEINLVQHTAKRDKGPQFAPPLHALVPAELPNHQTIRDASNVRNETKMKKYDSLFFYHRDEVGGQVGKNAILSTYPEDQIRKVARYERVQFSSSINAKKPSHQNKHFILRVVLGCVVDGTQLGRNLGSQYKGLDCLMGSGKETFIPVSEMRTPPLVIRGRSPSNYTGHASNNPQPTRRAEGCASQAREMSSSTSDHNFEKPLKRSLRSVDSYSLKNITNRYNENIQRPALPRPEIRNVVLDENGEEIAPQTMSYIEKVLNRNYVATNTVSSSDGKTELLPRPAALLAPIIGMKDIELRPILNFSYHRNYDSEPVSISRLDPFSMNDDHFDNRRMSVFSMLSRPPSEQCEKRRKLQSKASASDSRNRTAHASRDLGGEDSFDFTNPETSYNYHHCSNISKEMESGSVPRLANANPMDISFCLGLDADPNMLRGPLPSKNYGRRLFTANAKPSDVLIGGELFDEPSFYHQ
ncbi:LAMI_0B01618g1_1 [Lachancea mirantina]|uniref:LAMI_0B01618g1_1 n=1 Tax=Lachancea mirantina TaxID=1230905 RepID=A0A1G4ITL2_9SACH|nr:LAMI_0B01618g1_1 [Lachancea mirantina]